MVRYSKLPFRLLARSYSTDVTYVPMMLAHEFIRSPMARDSDFTTHPLERADTRDGRGHALVAQFASSDPVEFARAAGLIAPWVDGVDLNCGCPQAWALREGIGCSLMGEGALVAEMVRAARAVLGPAKSVSVKIRIHADLSETLAWLRRVASSGAVDYVTIHGRTRSQRSSTPPDLDAIRVLTSALRGHSPSVRVVANGDAYCLSDVRAIAARTGVDGVMAARGILENPAMFGGLEATPRGCVGRFVAYAVRCPVPFALVLHHVLDMTGKWEGMGRGLRRRLAACEDLVDLIELIEGEGWVEGEDMGEEKG